MSTTFNMFDLIFMASAVIFLIVAFFRGFVKEIFALLNWILAISLTYFLSPFLAKFIESYSHNKASANIISTAFLFIIIFIASVFLLREIANSLKDRMPATLDQILGVVFGALKTFLVFGLVFAFTVNIYSMMLGKKTIPNWLQDAKCKPYIEPFGKAFDSIVKKAVYGAKENFTNQKGDVLEQDKLDEKIEEVIEEEKPTKPITESPKQPSKKAAKESSGKNNEKGYTKKEIEKMNRLIEIVE